MEQEALLNLTPETYECPKGEERSYHVLQEVKQFDPKTGKRISSPRIQKYGAKMWNTLIYDNLLKQGYDIKILHDPKKWEAEHQAELKAAAKAKAEAKAAEEKAAFDAAVAAAVAKALAAKDEAPKQTKAKKVKSSIN